MTGSNLLKNQSLAERFEHIGWTVTDSGCWEFNSAQSRAGRPVFTYKGQQYKAYRVAYELWVGPVPEGHLVRHRVCDNPPCVRPDHLRTGTHADNSNDKVEKGRQARNFGERNGLSSLTEDEVQFIRIETPRYLVSHEMLGEVFGVSRSTIGNILRGATWVKT